MGAANSNEALRLISTDAIPTVVPADIPLVAPKVLLGFVVNVDVDVEVEGNKL